MCGRGGGSWWPRHQGQAETVVLESPEERKSFVFNEMRGKGAQHPGQGRARRTILLLRPLAQSGRPLGLDAQPSRASSQRNADGPYISSLLTPLSIIPADEGLHLSRVRF